MGELSGQTPADARSLQHAGREPTRIGEHVLPDESIYRSIIDACPDAVALADLQAMIQFVSPESLRVLGVADPGDLVGRSVFDCVDPSDHPRLMENIANLLQGGPRRHTVYTAVRRDGSRLPVEVSSAMVRDAGGQPVGIMAVIRDVSDRVAADQALRARDELLRLPFDEAPVGMLLADASLSIIRANAAAGRLFGEAPADLVGRTIRDITHPDDWAASAEQAQAMLSGRINSFALEKRYLRRDGSTFWARATVAAARHADGRLLAVQGVLEDISQRMVAAEAAQRERRTLQYLLKASDYERQLIAYELHDGLAQCLSASWMQLQGYCELRSESPDQAEPFLATGLDVLQKAMREARRLIAGVRPAAFDDGVVSAINRLIDDSVSSVDQTVEFSSRCQFGRLAPLTELALYRIVQEALTNASRHSQSERVRIRLAQRGDTVRVTVRDWGAGFDPTLTRQNRFGLEGIQLRARLLGGRSYILSKPGKGTLIVADLPLVAAPAEVSAT